MGTILVDNHFYLEPEEPTNAVPPHSTPGPHQSRIADFKYRVNNGGFLGECDAHMIVLAAQLQALADKVDVSGPDQAGIQGHGELYSLDRLYYENNWEFARNYLCRKFVKGIASNDAPLQDEPEDRDLVRYQQFLHRADDPDQLERLDFSYTGPGTSSKSAMLMGLNRLIYHFGFDWVAIATDERNHQTLWFKRLSVDKVQGTSYIVRRRTCVAAILNMTSTTHFMNLVSSSWKSKDPLLHRRTVILFNQLHSMGDGLPLQFWLAEPSLWNVHNSSNTYKDDETTAIVFISRLTCQIWENVVHEWRNIVDQCSEHIGTSETKALDRKIKVDNLERLAQKTWEDSHDWSILSRLINAQRKTISAAKEYLQEIANAAKKPSDPNLVHGEMVRMQKVLDDLAEMETIVSQDFPRRGQSISDLVYNIINVRNAQAAENYNKEIGAVTWITFIFFPLIAVSGMFGMNVNVLADSPSIKWYFIIAIPFTVLVLIIAGLIRGRKWIRAHMPNFRRQTVENNGAV